MQTWRLICVGRSEPRFVREGLAYYVERLRPYVALEVVQVRAAAHSGRDPAAALRREAAEVERRLRAGETVVLLDERGRRYDSAGFAGLVRTLQEGGAPVSFVIGGAYGAGEALQQRADHRVALSALTFPHQLVRVIFAEQLYRAVTLLAGHGYHH